MVSGASGYEPHPFGEGYRPGISQKSVIRLQSETHLARSLAK